MGKDNKWWEVLILFIILLPFAGYLWIVDKFKKHKQ